METPSITIKRIGGYVFIISLLLLGCVMCAWWVLSEQLSQKSDSTSLVNFVEPQPGQSSFSSTTSETLQISTHQIIDGAVTTQQIAAGGVEKSNLSPALVEWIESLLPLQLDLQELLGTLQNLLDLPLGDITSPQILDGTVALVDLEQDITDALGLVGTVADGAITSIKIADGAIQLADLDGAIVGTLSLAGTVADNSITSIKIVDGAVAGADIAAGAIDTLQIAANAVTSGLIADGVVSSAKITDGTIVASDIATGVITSVLIADGTIDADDLAAGIIDGALLAANSVSGTHIVDGAVSGIKILDGTIGAADIAQGVIDSDLIADGTISEDDLASGAVDTLQLADGAVTSAKIFDGTIAGGDMANGAVGATQLADGAVQATKLSVASGKRTVSVQIGDISIVLGDTERPIFVAPTNGTITKVTFTNALAITAGTNKGTLSVERKTATAATVASVDLEVVSMAGYTPQTPALGGGTAFSTGDVYSFKWDAGLIGVALTGFLVTIEYVPSE